MKYAEITVNSPLAQRRILTYAVPAHKRVIPGQAVWIPFGSKTLQGIVLQLTDHTTIQETREISEVIDPQPLLSSTQLKLAHWLSDYYLSPIFASVAPMLPPGFEQKLISRVQLNPNKPSLSPSTIDQNTY